MPRATNKTELLMAADSQFNKLWKMIESMSFEKQNTNFNFEDRDKNIKDVLVHLYEWHQLLINWINNNLNSNKRPFLPEPYNWKTYPEMNIKFWEKHQKTLYYDSIKMLKESHKKVISLIEKFSNEELFIKKYFDWTGTTALGSYCISVTASHYDWAMKKIKRHITSIK